MSKKNMSLFYLFKNKIVIKLDNPLLKDMENVQKVGSLFYIVKACILVDYTYKYLLKFIVKVLLFQGTVKY